MPSGGARPGAGRPKGYEAEDTKIRREMKHAWLKLIQEHAEEIFKIHLDQAKGVYHEVVTPSGKIRVYRKAPNPMSLEWIMQHVWGLAPLKIDLEADIKTEDVRPINPEHYGAILGVMEKWGIVKPEQAKEVAAKYEQPNPDPAIPAADTGTEVDVAGGSAGDTEKS